LEKACELEPDNNTYQITLARLQRILGQRHEAQQRYEHVLEQEPDNLAAMTALAEILASDKQWDAALTLLQRAAALQPDDANLLLNRANVLLRASRANEALEPALKAYDLSGQSLASASVLASAFAANGQWASARDLFEKCNQLNPNDPATLQRLAWLYATCPDAAVRDGHKAMQFARAFFDRIGGSSPTSWDTLAAAAARLGNFDQAIDAMHQAIARLNDLGRSDLVRSYQQRLDLYEQQKPYEQTPSPTASVQTDQ
jgi:tetratricopeptide (TPR) repeat protein